MSQRLLDTTNCLWCLLFLYAAPSWVPVQGVSVRNHPKTPSTIEAQAKFFQDFFSVQLSPYKIEFGHVCEDPNTWEQRYEKKDFKNHRDMGKVRWGDKKGGYGEHYWDLNHAGHTGNQGDHDDDHYNDRSDDGSYHNDDGSYNNDDGSYHGDDSKANSYGGPKHPSPIYENEEYDPENASYEENGRAKRAHPRVNSEKKQRKNDHNEEESNVPKLKHRKNKEQIEEAPSHKVEKYSTDDDDNEGEEEETYKKPKRLQQRHSQNEQNDSQQPKEPKNQFVLVVKEKDKKNQESNSYQDNQESQRVPYEGGAGVRQHYQPEVTAAASIPRLFLEPSTGHVVDRATGQAYVLQPIAGYN